MKSFVKLGLCALAFVISAGAYAEDTEKKATEEFPLGKEPEVQVGQTYLKGNSGDWEVRCVKVAEGAEPCHIYQLLKDGDGVPVAEISIFHLPNGGAAVAGATAVTPLGTLLTNNLIFAIDDKPAKQYPFNWCENVGCISRMGFTGLEIEAMKKGKQASITIASIAAPDKPVTVAISLSGFSDGFKQILVKP